MPGRILPVHGKPRPAELACLSGSNNPRPRLAGVGVPGTVQAGHGESGVVHGKTAPVELAGAAPEAFASLSLSIGLALRSPGSGESNANLMRRADMAMYRVKRAGRNHWQVSAEGDA